MSHAPELTLGVEEELQVADPRTGELASSSLDVLSRAGEHVEVEGDGCGDDAAEGTFTSELLQSTVETATGVCSNLDELRTQLVRTRQQLAAAAREVGRWVVASGTLPTAETSAAVTPDVRYREMVELHGQVAREQIVCGCHVHVGVSDPETAVHIANRVRRWTPVLLAMSANSPFWRGADTSFASYRTMIWGRWPSAGPYPGFADHEDYQRLVDDLLAVGVIRDRHQVYWDLRLSDAHPTLEFRVADVCLDVDDAVLHAALCRALARTAWHELERDSRPSDPEAHLRPELLTAARWTAARFGLDAELVDLSERRRRPAREMVEQLLAHVGDALDEDGSRAEVEELVDRLGRQGTGARVQRWLLERTGDLHLVVAELAARTAGASPQGGAPGSAGQRS